MAQVRNSTEEILVTASNLADIYDSQEVIEVCVLPSTTQLYVSQDCIEIIYPSSAAAGGGWLVYEH